MTVDYDLIVLGGSSVGRYAAAQANQYGARVALIEPSGSTLDHVFFHNFLTQLNPQLRSQTERSQWIRNPHDASHSALNWDWQPICRSAEMSAETLQSSSLYPYSLPHLATVGVEVIVADGSFPRQPRLSFAVADRLLRARNYLLAVASQATPPPIPGITEVAWMAIDQLTPKSWPQLPQQILILGNDPRGLVLAQVLNRLGSKVILLTSAAQLLPHESADISFRLQAQLEAEGVIILTQTQVRQVRQSPDQIWIETDQAIPDYQTIATDALLLATRPQPRLRSLNLEVVGVQCQADRLLVNRKLQTTQPRIYACGDSLGGYSTAAIDRYEADVALHNALFWPNQQVNYRSLPWGIFTDPQLARIGLTEAAAKQSDQKIFVAQQSFKSLEKAHHLDDTDGFFQLIAQENGEILGAQAIGPEANEWMGTIALAMQHHLKLRDLSQSTASPSFSEVIQQTANQLQHQCRPDWKQTLLAAWFDWRRSR